MKTFIISLVIFFAVLALTIYNAKYIDSSSDKLTTLAENILTKNQDKDAKITELENFWKKSKTKLEISANHTLINSLGLKIKNIRFYYENGEALSMKREIMLLKEELRELRQLEKISFDNIF